MTISTTLITTTVVPSSDSEVTIESSTAISTVITASNNEAVVTTSAPVEMMITSTTGDETVVVASTPSETTVTVNEDSSVTINTIEDPAVQLITADTVAEIGVTFDAQALITVSADSLVQLAAVLDTAAQIVATPVNAVQLTVVSDRTTVVETPAAQGPAGPQGETGPPGGARVYDTLVNLPAYRVMILQTDATLNVADSTQQSSYGCIIGFTSQAWSIGEDVNVIASGFLDNPAWSFIAGRKVFVGVDGELAQVLPPSAIFYQAVGMMLTSSRLLINIEDPILLN